MTTSEELAEEIRNQPYFLADPSAPHPELPTVGTTLTRTQLNEAIKRLWEGPGYENQLNWARDEIAWANRLKAQEERSDDD